MLQTNMAFLRLPYRLEWSRHEFEMFVRPVAQTTFYILSYYFILSYGNNLCVRFALIWKLQRVQTGQLSSDGLFLLTYSKDVAFHIFSNNFQNA